MLSEYADAGKHRRLRLRLAVAAHGAIDHDPVVLQARQRGIERVKWLLAWFKRINMLRIERERAAAVLPVDASPGQHHAAAKLVVDALYERHGPAFVVDHSHPDGDSRTHALAPRKRTINANGICIGRQERICQTGLRIDLHMVRVCNVLIPDTKR